MAEGTGRGAAPLTAGRSRPEAPGPPPPPAPPRADPARPEAPAPLAEGPPPGRAAPASAAQLDRTLESLPSHAALRDAAEREERQLRSTPGEPTRRPAINDRECMRCHPRRDPPAFDLRAFAPPDHSAVPGQMAQHYDRAAASLAPLDRAHLADRYGERLRGEQARSATTHHAGIGQARTELLRAEAERLRQAAPGAPAAERALYLAAADGLQAGLRMGPEGSQAGLAPHRRLTELARDASLDNETRRHASQFRERLAGQIHDRRAAELAELTPERALAGAGETARALESGEAGERALVRDAAERMRAAGREEHADGLRGREAERRLDGLVERERLGASQRAVRGLDAAAELLDDGYGPAAARLLEREAGFARGSAAALAEGTGERQLLEHFATNADARAGAYRAVAPQAAFTAATALARAGGDATRAAERLRAAGQEHEARVLEALGADSRVQAELTHQSARNTSSMLGRGILQTYRSIVNASMDRRIDETGTLFGLRTGPRDRLVADRARMQTVFAELDRTMREGGISLDRAWNEMFDDRRIDGWGDNPRRVPGFPTRSEAAAFLRDHPETRGLLMPFADLAAGFQAGDGRAIDGAQAQIVRELRAHGQWDLARQVLDQHRGSARTDAGRAEAARLDASERGEWWRARAGEFVERDLPVLVLTGLLTGGAGWGVRALGTAAGWGARAVRGAQLATELGAFVPTERVMNELLTGRRADWSAGALARDYAWTLGGYGLFRAMGRGWQYFRDRGAGQALAQRPYNGPPIEGAVGSVNRTIQALEQSLPGLGASGTRQAQRLAERTTALRQELELMRDALQRNPSAAGREAVERLSREAEGITRAAEEYARLSRPQLPRGRAATEAERAAHQQAMAAYTEREAALRAGLERQIGDYSQRLFRESAEIAGVNARPFNPEAGHFQGDPLAAVERARALPGVERASNVGYAELRVGEQVLPVGPAVSGTGPGSLPRTGPSLAGETRVLPRQPGQHGYPRANDSEVQLLEQVAERLAGNPGAAGTLRLYTELPPCPSCLRVMARFRQTHPNLRIEVFYGARGPNPWAGWLTGGLSAQSQD